MVICIVANVGTAPNTSDGQKSAADAAAEKASQQAKIMALMGGGGGGGGGGSLASLLGGGGASTAGGLGMGSAGSFGGGITTDNNMPGRPGYQMVPLGAIQHPMGGQPTEKHVLSQNAQVLKEEMIGYANAIVERMDRADILKKVESF